MTQENITIKFNVKKCIGNRELQKAYTALQKGIKYVQDDELEL